MDEWGDWIRHDGTYIPGPRGTPVAVQYIDGVVHVGTIGDAGVWPPKSWLWALPGGPPAVPIVAYRLRQGIEDGLEVCRQLVHAVLDHPPPLVDPVQAPPTPADPSW